jgi:sugar phosphate permease
MSITPPIFASRHIFSNFILMTLCAQFAFSVLAMKGILLPQMLELWAISKTQFGLLMTIYGVVHNIFYVGLSWAQDRFSPRVLIPANMVLGGITTFFLGQTSDFQTLCVLFFMLAMWCEGAFWPAILSSVRKSTGAEHQGKIFGVFEGGRGIVELFQNALTVALYATLGYSLLGLELAFKCNAIIMILLGIVAWFRLPGESLLKSTGDGRTKMTEVVEGMKLSLKLPEVWLASLTGFFIYFVYTSLPFYITYLNDLHTLPVLAVSVFGVVATSAGRIGTAFPAGFIATKFFGGTSGGMRAGLLAVVLLSALMSLLPASAGFSWVAMAIMMPLILIVFFMRALYFAPYGEMGLPPRFSGSVIAIAAFVVYLPSSFAYLLWGYLLDSFPGETGYRYLFGILACAALLGALVAVQLRRRISTDANQRIAAKVSELDRKLGLSGEEKSFSSPSN